MNNFIYKVIIYLLSFVLSIYGLSALDFNRLIKKGKIKEAWVLYFILACVLAYLFGSFVMAIVYRFN